LEEVPGAGQAQGAGYRQAGETGGGPFPADLSGQGEVGQKVVREARGFAFGKKEVPFLPEGEDADTDVQDRAGTGEREESVRVGRRVYG
jgi:hypothetical protein